IPSWFMLMPSETEMVVNSRGVPPASAIPAFAASTWKSWVMLQGVCSPFMLTTPIMGFSSAASSSPIARMKARCGARSRPSVVTRDRHFFMGESLSIHLVPANAETVSAEGGWFGRPLPDVWSQRLPGRHAALLQRRDDRRVLELRDVHLGQHARLGI